MRVLTVRQPWAWAIIHGGKDVENRSTNIAGGYRGHVAIHAGLAWDDEASTSDSWVTLSDALDAASVDVWDEPAGGRGAIIGVVDLTDVHRGYASFGCATDLDELCKPPCSPWAQFTLGVETYHLVLANPRPLTEPIPYRGALGLRTLPDDIVSLINERTTS